MQVVGKCGMNSAQNVIAAIGNTPLMCIGSLAGDDHAKIWVKWEGANPTGSMKDRMALSMIEGAEKRGDLQQGGRVVEYTGGSTGSSLAMVCAAKGYRAYMVSSDAFSEEKIMTMRAFGAAVEIIPSVDRKITAELIQAMIDRAGELAKEPNTFWTDQFNNVDARSAYHGKAEEILKNIDSRVDAFVMSVGTGACFSGISEILKKKINNVKCIAVEPAAHRNLSGGPLGGHRIEGIGIGFIPSIMRMDLVDEIVAVSDEDAFKTTRALAREEGIFSGISSGANLFAAMQVARKLGKSHNVVTVIVDSGLKYLQQDLFL
jgi:cysteine synthase A